MLFLTEIMRGMAYTLGAFFDKKVTVSTMRSSVQLCPKQHRHMHT